MKFAGEKKGVPLVVETWLARFRESAVSVPKGEPIYSQGDPSNTLYFVETGRVKISVVSQQGKEAVIALLGPSQFFGEGCLTGQTVRTATATALANSSIISVKRRAAIRMLQEDPGFSAPFVAYLLSRNLAIEEDLVDQLFNSAEKRLARVLLLLARFGKEGKPETIIATVSQETLAQMVGTTRSRISFFIS